MVALRTCWSLLGKRNQARLIAVGIAQIVVSLLDLTAILLTGVVASIALSASSGMALPPQITRLLEVVNLEARSDENLIVVFAALAAGLLVCKTILSAILTRKTLLLLTEPQVTLSVDLLRRRLTSGLLAAQHDSSQSLAYAVNNGVSSLITGVLGSVITVINESALLLIVGLGLLLLDPLVTIGATIFFLLIALAIHRSLSGYAHRLGRLGATTAVASQRLAQDALATYREVAVLYRQDVVIDQYKVARRVDAYTKSMGQFVQLIPKYAFEIGLVLGATLLCWTLFVTRGEIAALSLLTVYLAAATRVTPSILRLQGALLNYRLSMGYSQPTVALAAETTVQRELADLQVHEPTACATSSPAADFVPRLDLSRVTFKYPGNLKPALLEIDILVEVGQSLALVGPSGAGKSTIADVILGLLAPDSGLVSISGRNPREAIREWPGACAYVPQSVWLVEGTVLDNVALALPRDQVDIDRVWDVLESAQLAEFVRSRAEGLESRVGERGLSMSGGQRQRLGIARALYSQPRFLVLDEATSSLDAETEVAIARAILDLHGRVTTIIVAHRLATVREADCVVYLEDGRKIAEGSFSEVRRIAPGFDKQARLLGISE